MSRHRLLAAAVVLAATAPAAAVAKAPVPTHRYTFKVELEGRQTTTWSYSHTASGACDADQNGDGKETVRFHGQTKVVAYDGMTPPLLLATGGRRPARMALHGSVTRNGDMTTGAAMAPEACPDGVGGGDPPSDCGTRALSGLKVSPSYTGRRRMRLDQVGSPADFEHCFVTGSAFPALLDRSDNGSPVGQDLPPEELFEHGKHILIATGRETLDDGETRAETRIRWVLSLTRVKKEDL